MQVINNFPKELNHKPQVDYVTYTAYENAGPRRLANSACYSTHMSHLDKCGFLLEPNDTCKSVDSDTYLKFISLCIENQIIPENVHPYIEDNKIYLYLPNYLYNRHTNYITMCCYRWCAAVPKMIWQLVQHMENNSNEFTFWQALHFAMATWVIGVGHNFATITNVNYSLYYPNRSKLLSSSLAMKVYFEIHRDKRPNKQPWTYTEIDLIANQLDPATPPEKTIKIPWSTQPVSTNRKMMLESIDSLLTEKWTPLYKMKNPTPAKLLEEYDKLATS